MARARLVKVFALADSRHRKEPCPFPIDYHENAFIWSNELIGLLRQMEEGKSASSNFFINQAVLFSPGTRSSSTKTFSSNKVKISYLNKDPASKCLYDSV